ncbi:MAG TPA: PKD domain-containing protein, partial [Cyclobacteriaceae bacterium]|nr:PKD domain-containing protein [Cyclobacteriaceae bacterium]
RLPDVPGTCAGPAVNIEITVNPLPVLTASVQDPICSGGFVNITLSSDVANTVPTWTVDAPAEIQGAANGAGGLIFQTLFNTSSDIQTVEYTITPNANACTGTSLVISVDVHPIPNITGVPGSITICNDTELNIPLASSVANVDFAWTVSPNVNVVGQADGSGNSIEQTLTNLASFPGILTYTIVPTGPNNCTGLPTIMQVTVAPTVNGQWATPDTPICNGNTQLMFMQFSGQGPFNVIYTDGTSNFNLNNVANFYAFQVSPSETTTYTITSVTDTNGCTASPDDEVTITVGETSAEFEIVGDAADCGPFAVEFRHDQVAGTTYTWRWFDGQPDSTYTANATVNGQIIRHIFNNASPFGALDFNVTLISSIPPAQGGCIDFNSEVVTVYPAVYVNVFADKSQICSDETINLFNQTVGANSHTWFYRAMGTTDENEVRNTTLTSYTLANNTTQNPLTYEIVYRASNGNCGDEAIIPVQVYRGLQADFAVSNISDYVGGLASLNVTNTAQPLDNNDFSYAWDFGSDASPAGSNVIGPVFNIQYTTPGPKQIELVMVNEGARNVGLNCRSVHTEIINILLPEILAAFVASPIAACFPAEISITENTSTGDIVEWEVIDDRGRIVATSTVFFPVFSIVNPGTYTIRLTTRNSFTNQSDVAVLQDVNVYALPRASFDVRPRILYVPDATLFTFNFSQGANMYDWDFGDGNNSDEFQPSHTYERPDVYTITLTASFDHGNGVVCSDTLSTEVNVVDGGTAKIPNAFTPSTAGPSGGRPGVGTFNDVFLPILRGVEEFNMKVFDRWGNMLFESDSQDTGWDGYDRNGRLMPAGVYVYRLTLRLSNGQRQILVGDITLIR